MQTQTHVGRRRVGAGTVSEKVYPMVILGGGWWFLIGKMLVWFDVHAVSLSALAYNCTKTHVESV